MNTDNMKDTKLEVNNKSMVESIRISIKRNFDGVRFGPSGPDVEVRDEILKNFETIADKFKTMNNKDFEG